MTVAAAPSGPARRPVSATRRARLVVWPVIVATLLALVAALAPASAGVVHAAGDDLTITTATTYTLVPARDVVRVVVDVTARNQRPNLVSGGVVTKYFYDTFRLGIQPEAASIKATSGGSTLPTSKRPRDGFNELEIRFVSSLFFNQSAKVHLTFDLPGGAPRSKSEVRVGPAFATFSAWAFGDTGSVRIVVPAGFEAETTGSAVTRSTAGSSTVFTATGIQDVPTWYAVVNADRASALTNARIDLEGGEHLVVHAWPDDPTWKRQVTELLTRGLPELVHETGLSWPVTGDLDVFEVHTPLLEGYAGIFFEGENRIEISEDLDDLTTLHESSHAWFNGDLFDGRWINEGFADTFASRTLSTLALGDWSPGDVNPTDRAAVRLNDWEFPGRIADNETDAREQYGYDAAWTVVRSISAEVGPDGMREVLRAAQDHQIAYAGAGQPEKVSGPADWRRLLDLLDERGKSRTADDVFRQWVVTPDQAKQLDERDAAREAYAGLVDAGGDWLPPILVRQPLSDWRFAQATDGIQAAQGVLRKRDALEELATANGLAVPADLQRSYQGAASSFSEANAIADAETAAARTIVTAAGDLAAPRDALVSLGLAGTQPETRLSDAKAAFARGDAGTADQLAAGASAMVAGAAEIGRDRLISAIVIAVLAVLLLVAIALLIRSQRRHRRLLAATVPALAGPALAAGPHVPAVAMAHPMVTEPYATLAAQSAGPPEPATPAEPPAQPAAELPSEPGPDSDGPPDANGDAS